MPSQPFAASFFMNARQRAASASAAKFSLEVHHDRSGLS
jgi:hypothetical protein